MSLVTHGLPSVSVLGAVFDLGPDHLGPVRLRGLPRDRVALTFDDGPSPGTTPRILAALDDLGLKATFFVLGSAAAGFPGLVREIVRRGHEVGTHGMEHRHHLVHGPRWVAADLRASLDALQRHGIQPHYMRPPYGQASAGTLIAARSVGLTPVLWSCWGREFADRNPEVVAERIIDGLRPGAIALLHDSDVYCGQGSVDAVEAALPSIAFALEHKGLEAVTLGELLGAYPETAQNR